MEKLVMNEIIKERVDDIERKVGKGIVYPLNIVVPPKLVLDKVPEKKKLFGTVIPGDESTYIFKTADDYYGDYQESYFGYNWKKGQWDTGRNQEIIMNGCIPLFMDIDKCPEHCLMHHPKKKYQELRDKYYQKDFSKEEYEKDCKWLLEYCRENLTTDAMARFALEVTGKTDVKNVLYITLGDRADQLNDYLFQGFRNVVGEGVIDSNKLWWVYDGIKEGYTYRGTNDDRVWIDPNDPNLSEKDKNGLVKQKVKVSELRGGGMTYSGNIPDISVDRENIEDKIRERYFDLIVYGSFNRCKEYLNLVLENYEKDEVFIVDTDDDIVNENGVRIDNFEKYKDKAIYFCPDLRVLV
jgi:hypothetical protein